MRKTLIAVTAVALLATSVGIVVLEYFPGRVPAPAPVTPSATQPIAGPTPKQELAFFQAVDKDDVATARQMLAAEPKLIEAHSIRNDETPLHHVQSVAMATLLLDAGADINARDEQFDARPVRWAVSNWKWDVAKLLESRGNGDDDIFYWCATGNLDKLSEKLTADNSLAKSRIDIDILGKNCTLLHLGAEYGQAKVCELLIEHGADVSSEKGGFFNAQPLEYAAWAGYPAVVKALIAHGADVNAQVKSDQGTHTAIWWAALTGRKEVVSILLDAGATVEPKLLDAVRQAKQKPYPGRDLPPPADYDAVIDLLAKHEAGK